MTYFIYILYLEKSQAKFYVGCTVDDLNKRLRRHNSNHKRITGGSVREKVVLREWRFLHHTSHKNFK